MKFEPNVEIDTRDPRVVVDAGLKPGDHRFRLVVVNKAGEKSKPVEVTVTIVQD